MLAAQGGHTEMVKALIETGADVNLINFVSYSINSGCFRVLPNMSEFQWLLINYCNLHLH